MGKNGAGTELASGKTDYNLCPKPDTMKIAIATKDFATVAGHAGQARQWLVFDCQPGQPLPAPTRLSLEKDQVIHHADDALPHPLDGVGVVIAASAGDGFLRHMAKRGAQVLLTGETDPGRALAKVAAGEVLPDPRFNPTKILCKLKDLFSPH